jgi:hypothetical protein
MCKNELKLGQLLGTETPLVGQRLGWSGKEVFLKEVGTQLDLKW